MQINKITLTKEEQESVFKFLTDKFIEEDKRQTKCAYLNLAIDYEAELELYTEHSEPSKYNHETPDHLNSVITHRSVVNFRITFFHDGEEVEVEDWYIEDRIRNYYEI